MGNEVSITQQLCEKILSARPAENEAAMREAKRGVLDYLASAFAGRTDAGVAKLLAVIEQEGGKQTVPLIGQQRKANRRQSALLNGFMGHALDYDDVHSDVRGHPSTVILSALLALAADRGIAGERFLGAYIIGVEVMARLGRTIGTDSYLKGWHNTSLLGGIAATAAGGFLLNLPLEEMANAIGLAATQAGGLRVQFGTETKPLHAGLATQVAVSAIELTEQDFKGTASALDVENGFLGIYGSHEGRPQTSGLLDDWGKSWRIADPGLWFKLYPFCSAAYHGADAARELAARHYLIEEMCSIAIVFPPGGDAALIHRNPKTGEEGRFSIEYVVALALLGQAYGLEQFTHAPISPETIKLMKRMERSYNPSHPPSPIAIPKGRFTIVAITMQDGTVHSQEIATPKGSPGNPLSDVELEMKFRDAVGKTELAEELLALIHSLETTTVDKLIDLL